MSYRAYSIQPAHGGFGEYDAVADQETYEDIDVLLNDIRENLGTIAEFGPDNTEDSPDIRGLIHNEPQRVFVVVDPRHPTDAPVYCGISAE